jgi:nucleotide-binding universal stress UspA family protein/quercetin dioxygenase-like cupin family protein
MMSSIQTILHPTDFSDNSRYAFRTACSLAKDHQAGLILLHVIPPLVAPIMPEQAPNPMVSADSQECLKRWHFDWPEPPDSSIRVERRVAEGNPPKEILRLAQALKCDVIVMGTHGRTGLDRLLTGSVAEEVLRKAVCPVLVVRMPPTEAPLAEAEAHIRAGEIVDVRPLGSALASAKTRTLIEANGVQVLRLIVPAGRAIPEHKAKGAIIVHCLEGCVLFTALGKTENLKGGKLLYLPKGEPHTIQGVDDASLLVTILVPQH